MSKSLTELMAACPQGVEIRQHKKGPAIRIDFRWQGERCRETVSAPVTLTGIKYAANLRAAVLSAIDRGSFKYEEFFPDSLRMKRSAKKVELQIPTLVDALNKIIDNAKSTKSHSPSTIDFYRRQLNAQIEPKWGETLIDDITTAQIREWIIELNKTLKPKTIRNTIGVFSLALSQAYMDDVIKSNPLSPLKLRKLLPKKQQKDREKIDPFKDVEIKELLDIFRTEEERCLWQFAFATGLRTGELIAIKWHHIDTEKNLIHVIDNIVTAEHGTVEKDTKTGNVREVPILPAAKTALDTMRPITGKKPSNYIFMNPRTKERWKCGRALGKCWERNLKRTTIPYRNPYQTRHTFASKLLEQGEQELLVAKLLGHSSVEMVRRHYGRFIQQGKTITLRGNYEHFGTE